MQERPEENKDDRDCAYDYPDSIATRVARLSVASGVAEGNTRVRLAATQTITVVAKMNDGSFFTASRQVKVTIGGCGG